MRGQGRARVSGAHLQEPDDGVDVVQAVAGRVEAGGLDESLVGVETDGAGAESAATGGVTDGGGACSRSWKPLWYLESLEAQVRCRGSASPGRVVVPLVLLETPDLLGVMSGWV
ncbi:hypothetical protein DSY14_19595, partial [Nocardiopsis sp. MG754419]|nr:hypothetical protein [Nocardiopsis sp. MG754419]